MSADGSTRAILFALFAGGSLTVAGLFAGAPAHAAPATAPAPAAPGAAPAAGPLVAYARDTDRLTIRASGQSLRALLLELMRQSALEVRMDPAVERQVSADFRDLSLEQGVARLTTGLNVVSGFREQGKGKQARRLLVSVSILPAGAADVSRAKPLLDATAETDLRTARLPLAAMRRGGDRDKADRAAERWQSRLDSLPAEERAKYEKARARVESRQKAREEHRERTGDIGRERREARAAAAARMDAEPKNRPPSPDPAQDARIRAQLTLPDTPERVDTGGH